MSTAELQGADCPACSVKRATESPEIAFLLGSYLNCNLPPGERPVLCDAHEANWNTIAGSREFDKERVPTAQQLAPEQAEDLIADLLLDLLALCDVADQSTGIGLVVGVVSFHSDESRVALRSQLNPEFIPAKGSNEHHEPVLVLYTQVRDMLTHAITDQKTKS